MTTTIKGNLILEKDTVFDEGIVVEGSILGKDGVRYDLKVKGNIDCNDINCNNIECYNIDCIKINCDNIDCGDINCHNIDAYYIDCHNISAYFIICESIKQKEGSKLIARHVLTKRNSYKRKEQKAIE
jgi:hypothetical protein